MVIRLLLSGAFSVAIGCVVVPASDTPAAYPAPSTLSMYWVPPQSAQQRDCERYVALLRARITATTLSVDPMFPTFGSTSWDGTPRPTPTPTPAPTPTQTPAEACREFIAVGQ